MDRGRIPSGRCGMLLISLSSVVLGHFSNFVPFIPSMLTSRESCRLWKYYSPSTDIRGLFKYECK